MTRIVRKNFYITAAILFIVSLYIYIYMNYRVKYFIDCFDNIEKILQIDDEKIKIDNLNISDHQLIAYMLKSEIKIYKTLKDKKRITKINKLVDYLIDHADDNNDGEPGYGLLFAWDAFGDGSVNPSYHVYTIEVINVLDAFMDVLDLCILDKCKTRTIQNLIYNITMIWNTKYYTIKSKNGNFFYWYSISENDKIECINITAKCVGTFARTLKIIDKKFTSAEKYKIQQNIDLSINHIYGQAYFDDDCLVWNYSVLASSSKNDAIHHAFILEGINDYNFYRGAINLKYNKKILTKFIIKCIKNNDIYSYPDKNRIQAFNTGCIPLISNKNIQKQLLINSYNRYVINEKTDHRELSFLLYALSCYIESTYKK